MKLEGPMFVEHALHADCGGGGYSQHSFKPLDDVDIVGSARTAACVLFTGGRSARLLAERIHQESRWKSGRFEAIDCGGSEATLDATLFGLLEADAWPDAASPLARPHPPGTLYLQEVGRLSLKAQARLRDLLELMAGAPNRRARRRIMASTSEPLLPRVAAGTFDHTLYYRLNAMHFVLA